MEQPSFSIRPGTEDDISKIVEIERAVHVAPWTEEHFQAELQKPFSLTLVMTDDETDEIIAGYLVAWKMFEEVQILNVAVAPSFQRRGFAKALIRKIISMAMSEGLKQVILDVRKSNVPAIQLYQSIGFTIRQVRKNAYSNGEDAYEMALSLQGESAELMRFMED